MAYEELIPLLGINLDPVARESICRKIEAGGINRKEAYNMVEERNGKKKGKVKSKKDEIFINALIEKAEALGWTALRGEEGVDFEQSTPAGEDFWLFADLERGIVEEVREQADNFDEEEHVEMWVRARHNGTVGVPPLTALVEDAAKIQEMLTELAEALEKVQEEVLGE